MLTPGTILQNRYRIVNLIGKGGMGAVYEAKAEHLKCTVAVKEAFFDDDELRKAFEREAQLLAGFRHPALPKVMDHFAENGKHYLVMEFIEGDDLGRMLSIRGEAFPVDQVLGWADQLLGALEYLHARKIIHRDIKPANLKLSETGDLVLLDFGLAKGQHSQWSRVTGTSGESLKAYTPGYAPVEQVNGTGTDERSDLFAVGATLYHMLAGRPPADAMTRGMSVLSGGADLLRPPTEFNPRIPAAVEKVLLQSLALNREHRPASAAEMRGQLKGALSVVPVPEKPSEKPVTPLDEKQTAPMLAETRPADSVRAFEATKPALTQPVQAQPSGPRDDVPTQPVRPSLVTATKKEGKPNVWIVMAGPVVLGIMIFGFLLSQVLKKSETVPLNPPVVQTNPETLQPKPLEQPVSKPPVPQPSGRTFTNGIGMEFVEIPQGSFDMGTNDYNSSVAEKPVHRVTIGRPFYIGKYEVTQRQWKALMGDNPSHFRGDDLPVEQVSWEDAQTFILKLNESSDGNIYRLPTEAEWEYACRAGTTTLFVFGNNIDIKDGNYSHHPSFILWVFSDDKAEDTSLDKTAKVGSFRSSGWGLYDMHGNVWEWCEDVWHIDYNGAPIDGSAWVQDGDQTRRVLRGGSWNDSDLYCRSGYRGRNRIGLHESSVGFRVVVVPRTQG